jgi:hypothetical protein
VWIFSGTKWVKILLEMQERAKPVLGEVNAGNSSCSCFGIWRSDHIQLEAADVWCRKIFLSESRSTVQWRPR